MISIIIKSFNRPYYLDRCITSIYRNVKGNFIIKVVDDGTPEQYLQKLKDKFPLVDFKTSLQYNSKTKAIDENLTLGKKIDGFSIPTDLWYKEVKNSTSEYVLVTEDDVWFTKEINLNTISSQMKTQKTALTKLGWLGNFSDDKFVEIKSITSDLNTTYPKKIFTSNEFVMDLFMYNKYKIFSILYRFGMVDSQTKHKYWSLNSILMGLYQKEYWLHIWKDAKGKVDEKQQLRNASTWFNKNKSNKNFVARTTSEVMNTTFKSSATSSYHEYGNNFDVNRMNHILNEAWLKNDFDAMQNYPKDFSDDYIKIFLEQENHPDAQYEEWFIWAEQFRKQYRNLGAQVD